MGICVLALYIHQKEKKIVLVLQYLITAWCIMETSGVTLVLLVFVEFVGICCLHVALTVVTAILSNTASDLFWN